jgi:sulfotransferase family protein
MLGFVIGTGRCGSTLIHEVLARHPAVGFVSNLDAKLPMLDLSGRWNNVLLRRAAPRDPRLGPFRDRPHLLERGRLRVAPSEGWQVLERQVSPILTEPHRDLVAGDATPRLAARLRWFFERRMAAQGRPVFLHHVTGWPRAGLLNAVFPQARFIHVVRDGRAVANSWLQTSWWTGYQGPANWYLGPLPEPYAKEWETSGPSFVLLAGLGWKLLLDAFEAARAAVPGSQWLEVRYEDLLADPRGQIAAMLDFLGLQWTTGFEAGFSRFVFETRRREAFRRDLDADSLALLERSLAGHLRAYGYPTAIQPEVNGQRLESIRRPRPAGPS